QYEKHAIKMTMQCQSKAETREKSTQMTPPPPSLPPMTTTATDKDSQHKEQKKSPLREDKYVQTTTRESLSSETVPSTSSFSLLDANTIIEQLKKELSTKNDEVLQFTKENEFLEESIKTVQQENINLKLEVDRKKKKKKRCKQSVEDEKIYISHLCKHMDQMSKEQLVDKKNAQQYLRMYEECNEKLKFLLQQQTQSTSQQIANLQKFLVGSETQCSEWKHKYQQCHNQLVQHRNEQALYQRQVDQYFQDYKVQIEHFRTLMQENLRHYNQSLASIQHENELLKTEHANLLHELGSTQTSHLDNHASLLI
ncbi:hypothetical protein RFI_26986, partial [Reticulomyxa filosa]